jgi:DNA repair protein RecO (recombination protein O)
VTLYRDTGVVLRTYKLGEADRIVVVMTAGHGKVRAVAKGIRKTKSRFGARLEPPSNAAMMFYQGRSLDIITQAETIDHFRPIRDDLNRMTDAMALLEAVDHTVQEREPDARLYQMLVAALRTLADAQPRSPLLVAAFYWKLLSLEGFGPLLDSCASCGTPVDDGAELIAFDLSQGGALCRTCRRGVPVSPGALALMRRVLEGGLAGALAEPAGPIVTEVATLAIHSMEQHLERRLRAVRILDQA